MCGVAGFINFNQEPASPVLLKKMTDSISHRGPDGEGQWIGGAVAIGHRRLSIIDLSQAGHQPMQTLDGRFILSYNGEVYNFKEIRTQLEAQGVEFYSQTDSEVVLQALANWGPEALLEFNGMFALALWDTREETLLLARDRYGIKPMYFARQFNRFWFASEHKAIVADPSFARSPNFPALLEYMTFQNIFTDQTLLQDVFLLQAGHYMTVSLKNQATERHQYWDFHFHEPDRPGDLREYQEELDRLFRQAVKRQLVSDVEVGAYLSGGMDSGSITAVAATEMVNLKTFTVGFDMSSASGIELGFDERAKAEALASVFGTEQYEMVLNARDMERSLPSLAWALEEPRVGQSYPNFFAAKLAGSFVKVVLSGTGGDELFGGYPWRYYLGASSTSFEDFIDAYYGYWQRLASSAELQQLFSPVSADVGDISTREIFRDVFKNHPNPLERPEDYINHALYFESKTFLHGLLLVEDKMSMAFGLESRVPFLDNDLVDFAMAVPVGHKINNLEEVVRINERGLPAKTSIQFEKTKDGKQILRDVMNVYLPIGVTSEQKQGFSSPDATWFRRESRNFIRENLESADARINTWFNVTKLQALVADHLDGIKNRRLLIWSFINLEFWFRRWLP